jgi:hypothetical protein
MAAKLRAGLSPVAPPERFRTELPSWSEDS